VQPDRSLGNVETTIKLYLKFIYSHSCLLVVALFCAMLKYKLASRGTLCFSLSFKKWITFVPSEAPGATSYPDSSARARRFPRLAIRGSLQRTGQTCDICIMYWLVACRGGRLLSNYLHRMAISMWGKEDDEGLKFKGGDNDETRADGGLAPCAPLIWRRSLAPAPAVLQRAPSRTSIDH